MHPLRVVASFVLLCALALSALAHADDTLCDRNHYILSDALNKWVATGRLGTARTGHTATRLIDGRVLVAGGWGKAASDAPATYLDSAEIYDPATSAWTPTGRMGRVRGGHTASLLPNGKVMVVGGEVSAVVHGGIWSDIDGAAELYDPATGTWSASGHLVTPRDGYTATSLADGRVLVAGGVGRWDNSLNSTEIYDPDHGTWAFSGNLDVARLLHTATLLANGTVLVAGGWNDDTMQASIATAELYDPATGTSRTTGSLDAGRAFHTATPLADGHVLVTGGYGGHPESMWYGAYVPTSLSATEIYDPQTGAWQVTGSLGEARSGQSAILLPDATLLVVGGFDFSTHANVMAAERYQAGAGSWLPAGTPGTGSSGSTLTLLANGNVLVAGGDDVAADGTFVASAATALYEGVSCAQ